MDILSTVYSRIVTAWPQVYEPVSAMFASWTVKIFLPLALIANGAVWYWARSENVRTEGLIALHYQVDFGVDLLGDAGTLYAMPVLGLFTIAANAVLASGLVRYKDGRFFSSVLTVGSFLVNLYLLAASASLSFINI